MFEVICVGSATIDTFLTVHQKLKSVTYGTKVLVKHLERHTGGGGSNAAVALSKLGLRVAYLGKLSRDSQAKILTDEFKKYKIKILNKNRSKLPTDTAFILNSEQEKDRIIYVYKGASDDLRIKDLPAKLNTRWFYLATLIGPAFPALTYLSGYASKNKIKLLFNPSSYLARQGLKKLKPILKKAEVLILNQEEAKLLLKTKNNNPVFLLKNLKRYVKGTIIITNGPKELWAFHDGYIYTLQPPKIKVRHTAGAGDAFNSGFLAGVVKGYFLEEALKLGMVNAVSVIQQLGTKTGLLTEEKAKQLIKKYKIKVAKRKA